MHVRSENVCVRAMCVSASASVHYLVCNLSEVSKEVKLKS